MAKAAFATYAILLPALIYILAAFSPPRIEPQPPPAAIVRQADQIDV